MTILIVIGFLTIVGAVVFSMWLRGDIDGVFPHAHGDRVRFVWGIIGVVNFIAFVLHALHDGTCAFPTGGTLEAGRYLVPSHGKLIPFTPRAYIISYVHGVTFVVVHLACMVAICRLRKTRDAGKPEPRHAPVR